MMLYLASNSPRRKQLLEMGGWKFHLIKSEVDETPHRKETPSDYVKRLARDKVLAASRLLSEGIIIAADTTVAAPDKLEECILGKPSNQAEAEQMLRLLRGKVHRVYTGIALLRVEDQFFLSDLCMTGVPMRNYSNSEMMAYIATSDPYDKAGGYAIQHKGFHPVNHLQGCYANVMGLPVCHLSRNLEKLNLKSDVNIASACRNTLAYDCSVTIQILDWRG
jgi:septum formation protein